MIRNPKNGNSLRYFSFSEPILTMNTQLYVGNLSPQTSELDLRTFFAGHGTVSDVSIPKDHLTGEPRGFAFITLGSDEEMKAARIALNGKELHGLPLTVNPARSKGDGGNWQQRRRSF